MAKIRMAQYGAKHGHAGGKLLSMLENPDVEVVGIYEPDTARREAVIASREEHYKRVHWFDSLNDILA